MKRPKWYNPLEWFRLEYSLVSLSWNFIEFELDTTWKKGSGNNVVFSIGYDLFVQKMKDWNVDVPYVPWPNELRK
ncbi:MAG: hypothetical protein U0L05_06175 [Schaedlerella sp.]|nr:hypothetical protein [Schaedlerella sp.]